MKDDSVNKLKDLVNKRKSRGRIAGGEIMSFWGILIIAAMAVFTYMWPSTFVWVIALAAGIIAQISYFRLKASDSGFSLFWFGNLKYLWLFMLLLLPFLFYIFPFLLNVYPPRAINPLIFLWISIGMFASGLIVEHVSIITGGLILLLLSILSAVFIDYWTIIFYSGMISGVIIPGIWSRYEEKKG